MVLCKAFHGIYDGRKERRREGGKQGRKEGRKGGREIEREGRANYGLKNLYVETLTLKAMVLGEGGAFAGRSCHEGRAFRNGISAFTKEAQEALLPLFNNGKTQQEGAAYQPGSRPSSAPTLNLLVP